MRRFSICGNYRGKNVADKAGRVEEASRKEYPRNSGCLEIDGGRHRNCEVGSERRREGALCERGSGRTVPPSDQVALRVVFFFIGGGRRAGARLVQGRGTPRRLWSLSQRMPSARTTAIIFRLAARYLALPSRPGTAGARTICHKERLSSDKYLRVTR